MKMNEKIEAETIRIEEPKPVGRPKGSRDKEPRSKRGLLTDVAPGDIARITKHNMELLKLPEINRDNIEEVEERIYLYFEKCIENDVKPGVAGLCLALGITRQAWSMWGAGERRNPEYQELVRKTRLVMESIMEQYMLQGKINPVTGIFLLKNNFGYKDQSEHIITPGELGDRPLSTEAIKRKYLEAGYNVLDDVEYPQLNEPEEIIVDDNN